ncbi:enoyl-CoA hydratase [Phenylobacterium soli]|uniref:Enoyl-CoA hydratase n=1 Tax=Phenylobacterium soli TaxID=2170551 RepID=A0A328AJA2_9CAUL|nr:enoyl-CoA hydratase [Phenylobacterium soli]RAK55023.1 enoyl-CoA hydratase [Phenylobacterium soli]
MTATVQVRIEERARGRVAFVAVDNPAKLNSLSSEVMDAFVAAFAGLAEDPELRCAVLTGAGDKAFVGGANIDEMAALASPAAARAFIEKVHACCQAVRDLPCPVVARINGYCLGAGLEIAAACDLRLVSDHAVLGMPEVKLGLPSVVEAALLPTLVGWGRARWMLMTGETFTAEDACRWGFAEAVYPADELDLAVEALVTALIEPEPRAVRLQKALMQRWEELPMSGAVQAGVDAFEEAFRTDEPARAMADFLARRKAAKR